MSNYIDRMEIGREYERLKAQRYGDVHATISKKEILNLTLMAIDSCPTADAVEVKHGYWKETPYTTAWGKGINMQCSVCGDEFTVSENTRPYERYCRYCGAKMDGETE